MVFNFSGAVDDYRYGKYMCTVGNKLGNVSVELDLVPPGKPDSPAFLDANATAHSIELAWMPGFDGGSKQEFNLVYHEIVRGRNVSTGTASVPGTRFYLNGLRANSQYLIYLSAINEYGASEPSECNIKTLGMLSFLQLPVISFNRVLQDN